MTGFSKVTRFLQDTFIAPDPADDRAIELLKVSRSFLKPWKFLNALQYILALRHTITLLQTQPPLDIFSTDNEKEPGYELVERVSWPINASLSLTHCNPSLAMGCAADLRHTLNFSYYTRQNRYHRDRK